MAVEERRESPGRAAPRARRAALAWAPLLSAALALSALPASAAEPARRYAVVVAANQSLDAGVAPLSFADDDGAKYYDLLRAAGMEVALFAVLDPEAQRRFPAAARAAEPPRRRSVLSAVDAFFLRMKADAEAGRPTHFYFVYSGHGGLGANREGYVNLLDSRLRRSELYREILARSTATYNHLILDACHAYFLVQKRGAPDKAGDYRAAVNDFLRGEDLSTYPNTGVILAASSESETHEWSRWEAGIFSHELRSALLGAADVDGDGAVTYAEAGAFVEAANSAIPDPKARLRVWSRPPAGRVDVPLVELSAFESTPSLRIGPQRADRYHVEDARGVRVADLHPSPEQPVRLALVGQAPFFLRTAEREARIPREPRRVDASELAFAPRAVGSRGSTDATFRQFLFQVPFGVGFYRGLTSALRVEPPAGSAALDGRPVAGRGEKLLVLDLAAAGVSQSLARNLSEVVNEAAAQVGGYSVVSEASLRQSAALDERTLACVQDASCLPRAAKALDADKLLTGSVGRVGDTYQATLKLIDLPRARELDRRTETVQGREASLVPAVQFLAHALLGGGAPTGQLVLAVSVPGAAIRVDGREVGAAPLPGPLPLSAGKHRVLAEAPGFAPHFEEVVVPPGATQEVEITLARVEGGRLRPWGWSSLGAGALAGAGGAVAFYLASRSHEDYSKAADPEQAKALRQTTEQRSRVGTVLVGTAGAFALAGGALLLIDALEPRPGPRQVAPALQVSPDRLAVGIAGRW